MNMFVLILNGLAAAFLFNYSAYLLFWHNPRYMLFQLPKFFKQGPHGQQETSKDEKIRFQLYFYIAVLAILLGTIAVCTATYERGTSFWTLFLHGYFVCMFANIGDVLFLDIGLMGKSRDRLVSICDVYPENWTLKNILKKHTLLEHGIQFPLIICPFYGLVVAGAVRGLLALGCK